MAEYFRPNPASSRHELYDKRGKLLEVYEYGIRRSSFERRCHVAAWLASNHCKISEADAIAAYRGAKLSGYESAWCRKRAWELITEMAEGERPFEMTNFMRFTPPSERAGDPVPWLEAYLSEALA